MNENVVFVMGGRSDANFHQLANDIAVVVSDDQNLRVLSVKGGAAVQTRKMYSRNISGADHPGGHDEVGPLETSFAGYVISITIGNPPGRP